MIENDTNNWNKRVFSDFSFWERMRWLHNFGYILSHFTESSKGSLHSYLAKLTKRLRKLGKRLIYYDKFCSKSPKIVAINVFYHCKGRNRKTFALSDGPETNKTHTLLIEGSWKRNRIFFISDLEENLFFETLVLMNEFLNSKITNLKFKKKMM